MDKHLIDGFARTLARRTSRRRVIAASAALGGLVAAGGVRRVAAQPPFPDVFNLPGLYGALDKGDRVVESRKIADIATFNARYPNFFLPPEGESPICLYIQRREKRWEDGPVTNEQRKELVAVAFATAEGAAAYTQQIAAFMQPCLEPLGETCASVPFQVTDPEQNNAPMTLISHLTQQGPFMLGEILYDYTQSGVGEADTEAKLRPAVEKLQAWGEGEAPVELAAHIPMFQIDGIGPADVHQQMRKIGGKTVGVPGDKKAQRDLAKKLFAEPRHVTFSRSDLSQEVDGENVTVAVDAHRLAYDSPTEAGVYLDGLSALMGDAVEGSVQLDADLLGGDDLVGFALDGDAEAPADSLVARQDGQFILMVQATVDSGVPRLPREVALLLGAGFARESWDQTFISVTPTIVGDEG